MNNKNDNFLVGLLVVAIAIAVIGTWVNLQNVGTGVTGAPVLQPQDVDVGEVNSVSTGLPASEDPSGNPSSISEPISDCGIASDNGTAAVPPGETGWCSGGNWTTTMKNLSISVSTNSPRFNVNVSGINPFVYSNMHAGYANIIQGQVGNGENLSNGWNLTITPAEGTDSEYLARNVTGRQTTNITFIQGAGIHWNESQATFTMAWSLQGWTCNASTC